MTNKHEYESRSGNGGKCVHCGLPADDIFHVGYESIEEKTQAKHRSSLGEQHMNTLQLKKFIQGQLFEVNRHIGLILLLKKESQEIGANLSSLGSHNQDMLAAVGISYNIIPGILDEVLKKYQIMYADLENYMNGL